MLLFNTVRENAGRRRVFVCMGARARARFRTDACPSASGSYSVQSIGDILASREGYSFIV